MKTYLVTIPKDTITKVLLDAKDFLLHQTAVNKNPCLSLIQDTGEAAPVSAECAIDLELHEIQSWTGLPSKVDVYLYSPNDEIDVLLVVYDGTIDPGAVIKAQLPEA